jgi:predicted O-methyltransferase YrrM
LTSSKDFNSFSKFLDHIIAIENENYYAHCDSHAVLRQAATEMNDGLILEFGVAEGHSAAEMSHFFGSERTIHGFDSFEGLPEDWRPEFPQGKFACEVPTLASNIILHKGLFSETLPGFLDALYSFDKIAFLHLDADLYSSTAYVLEQLENRLVPGSFVVFDELHYQYNNYLEHEYKAFVEHHERTGFHYEFLGRRRWEAYSFKLVD